MDRIPEPELMEDHEQAAAYANADFSQPHNGFIRQFRKRFPGIAVRGQVLDLGCGPGDIAIRFARAFPACTVHGVDGSEAMLEEGDKRLAREPDVARRIQLIYGLLPDAGLPQAHYEVIISNSLLHHLIDSRVLWSSIKRYGKQGTLVFIMDLMRPETQEQARELVRRHAAEEPEILQHDFHHSLLAAYTPDEVRLQLREAGLDGMHQQVISDRHWIVWGKLAITIS